MKLIILLIFLMLLAFVGFAIFEFAYMEYTLHVGFGWTNETFAGWSWTNRFGGII